MYYLIPNVCPPLLSALPSSPFISRQLDALSERTLRMADAPEALVLTDSVGHDVPQLISCLLLYLTVRL